MGRLIPGISDNMELGLAAVIIIAIVLIMASAMKGDESYPRRRRRKARRRRRKNVRIGRAEVIPQTETFIRKGDDLDRARNWQQKYGFN